MKFHNQTACVKCTAMMSKDLRTCPICGAAQGASAGVGQRVTSVRPSAPPTPSYTPSYKAPVSKPMTPPPTPYGTSSSSRKSSVMEIDAFNIKPLADSIDTDEANMRAQYSH